MFFMQLGLKKSYGSIIKMGRFTTHIKHPINFENGSLGVSVEKKDKKFSNSVSAFPFTRRVFAKDD